MIHWLADYAAVPQGPASGFGVARLDWLRVAEYELTLFAAFWFVIGIADELAMDLAYGWLWLRRRVRRNRLSLDFRKRELQGVAAVFIPTWHEAEVIGTTIAHALRAWPQEQLRLYIGCYVNDPATLVSAMAAAGKDPRVRLVMHDQPGPSTKADCLNRLYEALTQDEQRSGFRARMVLLHDAEDMVHPAALALIDVAISDAEFVQIPVRPEPQPLSPWIAGHYIEEFAESHAKAMVVRDAFNAALPAAGVGCAIRRETLGRMNAARHYQGFDGPFEADCLTEDYELGLMITRNGGRSHFLRYRDQDGSLIATRSCFPTALTTAVRQKTRWLHGIAFQGWDRMGWWGKPADLWMTIRDRRGPMIALVLAVAYALLALTPVLALLESLGLVGPRIDAPLLDGMVTVCFAGLAWRALLRFAFTAREYGVIEGLRSVLRIPVANVIAIMAARRASMAYMRSLGGAPVTWDKTEHRAHPALAMSMNGSL